MLILKQLVYVKNASNLGLIINLFYYEILRRINIHEKYTITVNGTAYEVEVEDMGGAAATAPKAAAPKAAPAPAAAPAPKAAAPAPAANHRCLLAQLLSVLLCLVKFSKLKLKLATQLKLATY